MSAKSKFKLNQLVVTPVALAEHEKDAPAGAIIRVTGIGNSLASGVVMEGGIIGANVWFWPNEVQECGHMNDVEPKTSQAIDLREVTTDELRAELLSRPGGLLSSPLAVRQALREVTLEELTAELVSRRGHKVYIDPPMAALLPLATDEEFKAEHARRVRIANAERDLRDAQVDVDVAQKHKEEMQKKLAELKK